MAITIERQRPERGEHGVAVAPAGQCCCCCCCLHSVGSAIGALVARPRPVDPNQLPVSTIAGPTREPRTSATGLYWAVVGILSCLVGVYLAAVERHEVKSEEALLFLAIFFPAVQLAASVVAAIAIGLSHRPGKDLRLRHLGKITLYTLIGGVIGTAIMLPLFRMC